MTSDIEVEDFSNGLVSTVDWYVTNDADEHCSGGWD